MLNKILVLLGALGARPLAIFLCTPATCGVAYFRDPGTAHICSTSIK